MRHNPDLSRDGVSRNLAPLVKACLTSNKESVWEDLSSGALRAGRANRISITTVLGSVEIVQLLVGAITICTRSAGFLGRTECALALVSTHEGNHWDIEVENTDLVRICDWRLALRPCP